MRPALRTVLFILPLLGRQFIVSNPSNLQGGIHRLRVIQYQALFVNESKPFWHIRAKRNLDLPLMYWQDIQNPQDPIPDGELLHKFVSYAPSNPFFQHWV
jgi:hypothetical protein